MGDRGNIIVKDELDGEARGVVLYAHWRGSEIAEVVSATLARRVRWNDPAYLTRMLFCELVRGSEEEETGFGISPFFGDNNHPILVVDIQRQVVVAVKEDRGGDTTEKILARAARLKGKSFASLADARDAQIAAAK